MDESQKIKAIFNLLQAFVYITIILEIFVFIFSGHHWLGVAQIPLNKIAKIIIYRNIIYSKFFTIFMTMVVSIGTNARQDLDINPKKTILKPLLIGFIVIFGGLIFYYHKDNLRITPDITIFEILFIICALAGAILLHVGFDNISKYLKSTVGKDKWNVENESFEQPRTLISNEYSINIPMKFYYKKMANDCYLNIINPFRGSMVIGTPGSGKSFSIINPYIKQLIAKRFTMLLYDFKDPDLGQIAWHHFKKNKQLGILPENFKFHAINLNHVERSERINPLRSDYIRKLSDATETASALVEALKKGSGGGGGGADQFFTQSAINLLSTVIYFLSKYDKGQYSSLPHALALLNRSYDEIFDVLFTNIELVSLLSPFKSAYEKKSFNQLEGQLGTLKINISRLATKETFWVFSGDDFNLKFNSLEEPSICVLANDPSTQEINSACYSVVLNRMTSLINSKGNHPSAIILDEIPTIFVYKIDNLIATARSNKVAVLMGLQELTQFKQQYGKDTAATIVSVIGNVMAGAARDKDTLSWLETILGKVTQITKNASVDRNKTNLSFNEKIDNLVPASKIANLRAGEMVGLISQDAPEVYDGQYTPSSFNCKINLDIAQINAESKQYTQLPTYYNFETEAKKEFILMENFKKISKDIDDLVKAVVIAKREEGKTKAELFKQRKSQEENNPQNKEYK